MENIAHTVDVVELLFPRPPTATITENLPVNPLCYFGSSSSPNCITRLSICCCCSLSSSCWLLVCWSQSRRWLVLLFSFGSGPRCVYMLSSQSACCELLRRKDGLAFGRIFASKLLFYVAGYMVLNN